MFRRLVGIQLLVVAGFLAQKPSLYAHAGLHERIAFLSQSLAANPTNAEVLLMRGEAYRLHDEPAAAIADFERALNLNPGLDLARMGLGRAWLDSGQPKKALAALNEYLLKHTNSAEAFLVRARAQSRLGEYRAAANDYQACLQGPTTAPAPEIYLERSAVLEKAGALGEAIANLDAGITRLGLVPGLQLQAVDLELKQQHVDAALRRIDSLIENSARKEFLLVRRGTILEAAGRQTEARRAYILAESQLATLPRGRLQTPALRELAEQIRSALLRLPRVDSSSRIASTQP